MAPFVVEDTVQSAWAKAGEGVLMDLFTAALHRDHATAIQKIAQAGQRMDTKAYHAARKELERLTLECLKAENGKTKFD